MTINLKELNFSKLVELIQDEITMISATMKEKGSNRFARTVIICVVLVFGSYEFVYSPLEKQIAGIQRKIDAAHATAQYADVYQDLKNQLDASYSRLPAVKDRERWLTDTAIEALKAEGLISDSIVPPEEQLAYGFAVQRVSIALTAKFSELYGLVRRIETIRPSMHIISLEVNKEEKLEMNVVNFSVGTMIPVKKGS